MNTNAALKTPSLENYGVYMTKEEVAEALGLPTHIIPPLTRAGLLKPLGRPGRYCVKQYSRDALARDFVDPDWLERVAAAIYRHWRMKNARKRAKQAGTTSGTPVSESVTR